MFGPVDDDFYGIVGRIVMVAAILEDRLYVLYCQLSLQGTHGPTAISTSMDRAQTLGGAPGSEIIRECRTLLKKFHPEYHASVEAFLDDAGSALRGRHAVVHSLWSFDGRNDVRGWRRPRSRSSRSSVQSVEWTTLTADQLPDLLAELLRLVDHCMQNVERWVKAQ